MIHPNEVVLTPKSAASLRAEAEYMETHYWSGYMEALGEQLRRQMMANVADRAAEKAIRR